MSEVRNIDPRTVESFGDEWPHFDQSSLLEMESKGVFDWYFAVFPRKGLPADVEGLDMGCGSGWFSDVSLSLRPIGSSFALIKPTATLL